MVRIWDPITGADTLTLTGHTDSVRAVAIAPDGTWLATAGGYDGTARIWDSVTGSQHHILTGHTSYVSAVAIALDGTWLATTGWDGTVRIWDPVTGSGVASSRVAGSLADLEWSGETLVAGGAFGPYFFRFVVGQSTQ